MIIHTRSLKRIVIAVGGIAAGMPSLAYACSPLPVTVERFRSATVSFIGAAKSDTVRAGPGDVEYSLEQASAAPSRNRALYGQRVSVERVAGYAREMLPEGVREVVLIPWGASSLCHPIPWSMSVRWLEPGVRGVFTAELRAKSHWVNGVPTMDVFSPGALPYRPTTRNARNGQDAPLSADELLDVASQLPDPELMKIDSERAGRSFLDWAKSHRDVWKRSPADEVMANVMSTSVMQHRKRIRPEIAGTWKFTASVEGEPSRVLFARTHAFPLHEWHDSSPEAMAIAALREPWDIPQMRGYEMIMGLSPTIENLYTTCANTVNHNYMSQRAIGVSGSTPERIEGDFDIGVANVQFVRDTAFRAYKAVKVETAGDSAAFAAAKAARGVREGGVFFETGADGVMRVEKAWWLGAGRVLVIRGERVSGVLGKCEW
ncbi:MAG: hypothetical protein ACO1Q7_16330 [Gemmatimonas sp.]